MGQTGTGYRTRKRFALKRYFSLTSFVFTALIAGVLGWSYQYFALRDLQSVAEGHNIALTSAFSNALWQKFAPLVDGSAGAGADALRSRASEAGLPELVSRQMKGTDVVKVKVYSLTGMTVFSSDPKQTGEDKSTNTGFLAARAGRAASALTHRDTMDTSEGVGFDLDIISSYLPVVDAGAKVVGVIEIYSDVTEFVSLLRTTRNIVVGIVFGMLALLYGLLYWLVARAQTIIDRQATELEESLNEVRLANQELDRRVLERTQSLNESNENLLKGIEVRRAAEKQLKLAAEVFDNASEGILITDADERILVVNAAFTRVTGYLSDDAVGQTPRILASGRQDKGFYVAMWAELKSTGHWRGEIWNRRKNGEMFPQWLSITAVAEEFGAVSHYVGMLSDLSERKDAEEKIVRLAFYDSLTLLPNRRLLLDRLQQALAASSRSGRRGALLFIDLDNFKTFNDTLGHEQGDQLLMQVARRLNDCVRQEDTVGRLGGDEFVVVVEGLGDNPEEAAAQAETIGNKILAALGTPYRFADRDYACTPSIGINLFGEGSGSGEDLLKQSEIAMYQAKTSGRNAQRFFDPQMQAVVQARVALEDDMRQGLRQHQFLLYYQPQVKGDRLIGAEALVRWKHPQRGMVSPADFIPLAEETGLILPLGLWVLETACEQLSVWAKAGKTAHLTLAVNVSARQFRQEGFVNQVLAVLDRYQTDATKLKLELTESLLLDDVEDIIVKMSALKAKGVCFSLDDFGTGYSSLSYLKRLPLDQLKIDQSFVRDVLTDPNDAVIGRTIIALGQSLGLAVIAEGVETALQRDFLARSGCDSYQGYYFSRPLAIEAFDELMARQDG